MKKCLAILLGIFLIGFVSASQSANAFYGSAEYLNGESVESGTITAEISGEVVGSCEIEDGSYELIVRSDYGGVIYFYFDGLDEPVAREVFEKSEMTELDLVIPLPGSRMILSGPFAESHRITGDYVSFYSLNQARPRDLREEPNYEYVFIFLGLAAVVLLIIIMGILIRRSDERRGLL